MCPYDAEGNCLGISVGPELDSRTLATPGESLMSSPKLQHILFACFTFVASVPVILLGFWVQHNALENEIAAVEDKHVPKPPR